MQNKDVGNGYAWITTGDADDRTFKHHDEGLD
jgi:hypothetical protein